MHSRVRVLTFNVRMLPFFSARERAHRIANAIKSRRPAYDVVCLQEVFCRHARQIFVDELREDFPFIDEAAGGDRWRFNSGLFTASRFRPLSRSFESFGLGGIFGGDFLAEKGVVALELALDDTDADPPARVQLFHTHVQSLDTYRGTRHAQLQRVSRFIHRILHQRQATHRTAALLLGDLNVAGATEPKAGSNTEYGDLLGALGQPRDVFREANPRDPGLTHPATGPLKRLDYVLAFDRYRVGEATAPLRKWSIAQARVNPHGEPGVRLSDHLALEAELELTPLFE